MQSVHCAAAALLLLGLFTALSPVRPSSVEQWRSRTIYQVVTDRFARADCWGEPCEDLNGYCGGNFAGLRKMTHYIEEMGFDAVWWSPVTMQGSDALGGSGYHGYWPGDLYQVNPAFGTKEQLQALIKHYHNRDMYVMFDMVINHMGYGDISTFNPFNKSTDFHDCNGCSSLYCDVEPAWLIKPGGNWSNEHCKLAGLPDLNHSDPSVVSRLISWFEYTEKTFSPDGFRLDAAGHSLLDFCIALNRAVEPYTVGEILIAGNNKTTREKLAEFVERGGGDAVFAFPVQSALTEVFRHQKYDIKWLAEQRVAWIKAFGPTVHNMLLFADNHDTPRWLHAQHNSISRFKNALTYILFMEGIPVIYYGTEQGLTDPQSLSDPSKTDSRPPVWTSNYQHDHPLWLFLKTAVRYRKLAAVWDAGLAVQHSVDEHYLALSRGDFVIVLTGVGESGPPAGGSPVQMIQGLPERFRGRSLANVFVPKDVMNVSPQGVGLYQPDPQGNPQVFYLGEVVNPSSLYTPGPKVHNSSSTAVFCSFAGLTGLLLVAAAAHRWVTKHQQQQQQSDQQLPQVTHYSGWARSTPTAAANTTAKQPQTKDAVSTAGVSVASAGPASLGAGLNPTRIKGLGIVHSKQYSSDRFICHAALEYSIPTLGYTNQLMYGGMGMVVDTFIKHWPRPMALTAPLYKPCYSTPPAWSQASSTSASTAHDTTSQEAETVSADYTTTASNPSAHRGLSASKEAVAAKSVSEFSVGEGSWVDSEDGADDVRPLRPSFLPASKKPLISLTVDGPEGELVPVEVYKHETEVNGHPPVYYLIHSHVFSWREKTDIFTFNSEDEMLTWLAVFNKAVASVVTKERITHLQLHDYHAGLSLLYMREALRPAVMYVAHNAHYNAQFPVPTAARRMKVYACLNLNAQSCAGYLEHHGNVDVLKPVVSHLRQQQQGKGVIAVSARYAKQVCHKLSVFWQLTPAGRRNTITGILNSLDISSSLAASGLDLSQVLAVKMTAKLQLQQDYGLAVGEQYILVAFVGRMTQQKGCDIIAEAAGTLMAKHPLLQMVIVGPTGDPVGAAAISKLNELSEQYPDRMYCPIDHYVSGPEKEMLLQAADFCLLPSRFEPCGLVDVEFGWSGALTIGHDTGGLGKMPGVYCTAQATHLSHLAQKFEVTVGKALSVSVTDRHGMIAEALAKRFPVDVMMNKYEQAWLQINDSYKQRPAAAHSHHRKHQAHTEFFADHWIRRNQSAHDLSSLAQPTGLSTQSLSHRSSTGFNDAASLASISTCTVSRAASESRLSCLPACCGHGGWAPLTPVKGPMGFTQAGFLPGSSRTHRVSEYLLVVLQYFAMGPGMLLLTYLLMNEVAVNFSGDRCGFKLAKDLLAPKGLDLITASILFFAISTGMALVWFVVAARTRPVSYIRMSALLAFLSYSMTFLALYTNQVFSLALGFAAATNMVGRVLLAWSEVTRCALLCTCLALAAAVFGPLPHQLLGGMCMLSSAAVLVWFCTPGALPVAYHHLSLRFKGQWRILGHISCFWLSLMCSVCDTALLLINGYLLIAMTQSLATFAAYQAVAYGACALAVLWNTRLLSSRAAELRLNAAVMVLAAVPGHMLLKAVVIMTRTGTGALLAATAALDLVFSGRSSIMGLAGFLTLPSREVVCVWQLLAIMLGSGCVLATVSGGYVAQLAGAAPSNGLLVGVIGGLEGLRLICALLMACKYPNENLSAP